MLLVVQHARATNLSLTEFVTTMINLKNRGLSPLKTSYKETEKHLIVKSTKTSILKDADANKVSVKKGTVNALKEKCHALTSASVKIAKT
jgi:hypothetical protein